MTGLLTSELRKLRTVRAPYALGAAAVVLGGGMAALIILLSDAADVTGETGGRLVLSSGGIAAGVLTLMLGIVTAAGEFRHGTILPTLFVTPDRRRVALAQVLTSAVAGAVIGLLAVAVTGAVGLPLLAARDVPLDLSAVDLVGIAAGGVCFAALSAALGSALGTLLRNQVLALGLAMLVLFVLEPILTGLVDGYQRYSLVGLRVAMTGGAAESAGAADGGLPPAWLAVLLWTGYTVALVTAAITVTRRRDV